jgi:hypothetical protein
MRSVLTAYELNVALLQLNCPHVSSNVLQVLNPYESQAAATPEDTQANKVRLPAVALLCQVCSCLWRHVHDVNV